jgi:alkanesulfonate monooxygenase SsuD/methylene tetrahydromethanopterin reductase-like flavin-dependent oxidoreductase (luciferase family)
VEAFARNHRTPIRWAEKGARKEDYVLPWLRRMIRRTPMACTSFSRAWKSARPSVGDVKAHPEFEDLIAGRFIIGSAEQCATQIVDLIRATGCNRLVTRIQWLGMQHRYLMRTIELLGSEVAPLIRKAVV